MAVPQDQLGVRPTGRAVETSTEAADDVEVTGGDGEVEETVVEESSADLKARLAAADRIIQSERENAKFLKEQLDRATKGTNGSTQVNTGPVKRKVPLPTNLFETMADSEKFGEVLEGWIKEHGYMTAEEAAAMLNQKVAEVGRVGSYYQRYPELNDANSDLYKAAKKAGEWVYTQPEFAGLSEAGKHMLTLQMAVEHAEGLKAAGGVRAEAETDRKKKIARQTGPVGGGKTTGSATAEELTPEQKQVARGFGISEDEYRKYATKGVTMMRKPGGGS